MSGFLDPKSSVGNALKVYLFPVLVTILATMIWRDVTELRSDVKQLLAQSNVDKTDIQNMKRDIQLLDQAVFNKRIVATNDVTSSESIDHDLNDIALLAHLDKNFKHEDIFDIKKYLPKFQS